MSETIHQIYYELTTFHVALQCLLTWFHSHWWHHLRLPSTMESPDMQRWGDRGPSWPGFFVKWERRILIVSRSTCISKTFVDLIISVGNSLTGWISNRHDSTYGASISTLWIYIFSASSDFTLRHLTDPTEKDIFLKCSFHCSSILFEVCLLPPWSGSSAIQSGLDLSWTHYA